MSFTFQCFFISLLLLSALFHSGVKANVERSKVGQLLATKNFTSQSLTKIEEDIQRRKRLVMKPNTESGCQITQAARQRQKGWRCGTKFFMYCRFASVLMILGLVAIVIYFCATSQLRRAVSFLICAFFLSCFFIISIVNDESRTRSRGLQHEEQPLDDAPPSYSDVTKSSPPSYEISVSL